MSPNSNKYQAEEANPSGAMLAISWLFVGIPLLWGVSQTFIKALALFQ